jgi:BirA family biotin operon repressor/biotin-[acetyl-CoA-carboxylase] ligase
MNKHLFPLLRLMADGSFHSGEQMGAALGLTRAAVWHAVHALETQGLALHKLRGRGYRLAAPPDLLVGRDVLQAAGQSAPRLHLEILDSCASTNTLLMERARAGAQHASVVACELQLAGRGRLGRSWRSGLAGSLTFSLLWRFEGGAAGLAGLSLAVGVAVARALERAGVAGVQLKWPNDILHGDKKLAGILIETSGEANGPGAAVIGIGVNTRLDDATRDAIDQPATDIASLAEPVPARSVLLGLLLGELVTMLEAFSRDGFAPLRDEWQRRNVHQNQRVSLRIGGRPGAQGEVMGVADDGALLLRSARGLERIVSGDISLRREARAPGSGD